LEHKAEQEAIGKACGVPMAMLPGFSWAPPSSVGKRETWEAPDVARRVLGRLAVSCWRSGVAEPSS
jgi:hypothetical protein